MRVATCTLAVAGGLALLAVLPAAAEDLTIIQKVTKDNEPPGTRTGYISSDKLRAANPDGSEVIVDLAAAKFTMIDNKKKEYYTVTQKDMDAMAAQVEAKMKEMEPQMKRAQEQMKNMPPEMREKMEKMMGGIAAAVTVQKGTGGRKIAGYSCENWVISLGGMSRTEECLTTELQFPVQAWEAFKGFGTRMQSMTARMGPAGKGLSQLQEKMKDLKGFPLAATTTTNVLGKTSTTSSEVTEIRKGPIPASAWAIPADYKQVESPMAKGLGKQ